MKAKIVATAANNATSWRCEAAECVDQSDRGGQFRSGRSPCVLEDCELVDSVERVGPTGDRAAMESFFALRQNNILGRLSRVAGEKRPSRLWSGLQR